MDALLRLAEDRGLTAYDAAYLDCAARKGFALATLDENLRQACRAVGVDRGIILLALGSFDVDRAPGAGLPGNET